MNKLLEGGACSTKNVRPKIQLLVIRKILTACIIKKLANA